ncbi:cation:proton antiporter [Chloroflexota bacterium]
MEELGIGIDLIIVLATALAGGMIARRLRQPVILGYLAGGIAIGPHGFGVVHDMETVNALATIGVILLLFTLGIEFSLKELGRIGKIAILGGIVQILLTAAAGLGIGKIVGLAMTGMIFLGFLIALSSTMIVLKTLMERGELDSAHGRIMIGILLVQDLSIVPLMIILPALGSGGGSLLPTLGIAAVKAIIFIGIMLVLGIWVLPWLLRRVAGQRSRELFLLTIVILCLATAFGTYYFGLSASFGAFVAGLLISQSAFARQALADIVPLRDTFVALFFISLGMLVDLNFVADNYLTIIILVALIVIVKFVICFLIPWVSGYNFKTALFVGTGLVQIGEFSFIMARMGMTAGVVSPYLYSLTVASAIITMLLTPFAFNLASLVYRQLNKHERMVKLITRRPELAWHNQQTDLSGHAVICGYGNIGNNLANILERRNFPYLVIDLAPQIILNLRSRNIPCIYGDASNPEILGYAHLKTARVLICTFPDFIAVELTARHAREINPRLDIVARVHHDANIELLRGIGIAEVVRPNFEASLEITRHTLHRFGMTTVEIQYILNALREGKLV